jgi:hypothetical protein
MRVEASLRRAEARGKIDAAEAAQGSAPCRDATLSL